MPYTVKTAPVRDVLPKAALDLWVRTYNAVLEESEDEDDARMAAWSNVKQAGYRKQDDGKWTKSVASDETILLASDEGARILEKTEAMALPKAALSKVYIEFKYCSFDEPNANGDGFLAGDITDGHVETLKASPIFLQADAADHPMKSARATARAPFWAGSILQAEKREDGIWAIAGLQREILEDRGIAPTTLDKEFSVSMEVTFDRTRSKYRVGEELLTYTQALGRGIAAPMGVPDDPSLYACRFNIPLDFHGVALLRRGRNADRTADIVKVAAAEEPIVWNAEDYALHLAVAGSSGDPVATIPSRTEGDMAQTDAATLSTEERDRLPMSSFAYVDDDGEGHLPIHDAEHTKNALARLNQTKIPEAAKRKALKKIVRAAKKFGVDVDEDSDVMKRYGAHLGMEGRLQEVHEAFYNRFAPQPSEPQPYPYIRATYEDYVIAEIGDKTYRIDYSKKDDEIEFGDPAEVEVVYKPVKTEGARPSMNDEIKKLEMTQEDFDKAVEAKVALRAAELLEAKRAEIEAAAVEKAKPEIAKAAVEAFRAHEKQVTDRMAELGKAKSVSTDEREDLEQKVRESDDAVYTKILADRALAALEAQRREHALESEINLGEFNDVASAAAMPRGGRKPDPKADADPFRVTLPKA